MEKYCMHCKERIYYADKGEVAPEGKEHHTSALLFANDAAQREWNLHHCCLMDMVEWVSKKMMTE